MSFPRYERYKDSGVEWLGEVPEHWRPRKLGSVATFKGGGTPSKENLDFWNGEIPWVSPKDMKGEYLEQSEDGITPAGLASSATSLIPAGAILIVVRSGILKHTIPVAINRVPVTLNQDMKAIVLDPAIGVSEFFLRWVQGLNELLLHVWLKQGATVESVEHSYLTNTEISFPTIDEQLAICLFLKEETAKIDVLIEEQRRLIELLKEKRQAVISHAVTKGLKPDVVVEDSGMEWLGVIPRHWNSGVLVRIANRIVVGIAEAATHAYADEGVPILRSTNIRPGKIIGDILRVLPEFASERGSKLIGSGDLITVRTGNAGVTAVIPGDLDGCQCFTMLITSLREPAVPEFYCSYMNSHVATSYFGVEGWGTAQVNISVPILKALPIPIPPIEEQKEIVAYLNREVARIDELSSQADGVVMLLRERRSALISAAVTGKIDVRAYTAKPVKSAPQYSSGFAHQLLAAEILDRCNSQTMGRIKLQKLIHLCEYHGQVSEVQGDYSRKAAGPFDARAMAGISKNLKKQKWFEEVKEVERYVYRPLEKRGEHKKYLAHWQAEMPRIDEVLNLLGNFKTRECEIVSTLYAAWNDLLIDNGSADDDAILHEASSAERWHKSKEQIAPERWKTALQWMKDKGLVPVGYGKHTRHTAGQIETTTEEAHEPA
jgi:type I restriction enzyme S subunit